MKYLITSIILAIVVFVIIKGDEFGSPQPWEKWPGHDKFAKSVAEQAIKFYSKESHLMYKLSYVDSIEKRVFGGANRYRVKFCAKCVKAIKSSKGGKNGKGKKPVKGCTKKTKCELFKAVLRDEKITGNKKLTVTNVATETTYVSTKKPPVVTTKAPRKPKNILKKH
uniref:Cystatin domain-containing protein n=1 Tax=Strongyloides papillosus TaxID=174720 RepID=A0A0N5C053_STREA